MITKTILLKNIGKFYDFSDNSPTLDWHKNTFVFAPNAYGKSTLVNVLLSLRDNDPKLILGRKTLGTDAPPKAVIMIDGEIHAFDGTRWIRSFSAIQFFDVPFIHTNILTHEIGHEHKKNIHKIIIGAEGLKLAEELTDLKTNEKVKRQLVENLTDQFSRGLFTISIDAFLAIEPGEEAAVGQRIRTLEEAVKSKQSESVVQGLGLPHSTGAPAFDLSIAKVLATTKIASAHEAAKNLVLAHIDHNFSDKNQAIPFIRQGMDLMQAECPLCGQDLKNAAELLEAYREFFDEAFQNYQRDVAQQIASVTKWNLDNDLTAMVSSQNANLAISRQWEPFLGAISLPDVIATVDKCRPGLAELKSRVQSELEKKQKVPDANADLSQFDALSTELTALRTSVEAYNAAVAAFTGKAKQYVDNLPKTDVASIQAELLEEQRINMRFAPEWKKWVTDYPAAKKEAGDLLAKKEAKQKELEDYSKTIFDTYQKRINDLLTTMGTDFAITGLTGKTDDRANESYSDFRFLILEQSVPLASSQDDSPSFRNTLSEGDKSALAFAFFIAVLEQAPELEKQIVVFDDPLSSLDQTRREATARLLLNLSPKVNQLAVFTHNRDFLYKLCEKIPESKVLQIRSDETSGSKLAFFDSEEEFKSDYMHLVDDLKRYTAEDFGPTAGSMQGTIRILFETVLKTKYYSVLALDIKAKRGLSTLVNTLIEADLLNDSIIEGLVNLNLVSNHPHHGTVVDVTPLKLSRDELIPLIKEALGLVHKL